MLDLPIDLLIGVATLIVGWVSYQELTSGR
jgi:hypothetical protein